MASLSHRSALFLSFSRLPAKLRVQIWQAALNDEVQVHNLFLYAGEKPWWDDTYRLGIRPPIDPLLHICEESRNVVDKVLTNEDLGARLDIQRALLRFNPDTIWWPSEIKTTRTGDDTHHLFSPATSRDNKREAEMVLFEATSRDDVYPGKIERHWHDTVYCTYNEWLRSFPALKTIYVVACMPSEQHDHFGYFFRKKWDELCENQGGKEPDICIVPGLMAGEARARFEQSGL